MEPVDLGECPHHGNNNQCGTPAEDALEPKRPLQLALSCRPPRSRRTRLRGLCGLCLVADHPLLAVPVKRYRQPQLRRQLLQHQQQLRQLRYPECGLLRRHVRLQPHAPIPEQRQHVGPNQRSGQTDVPLRRGRGDDVRSRQQRRLRQYGGQRTEHLLRLQRRKPEIQEQLLEQRMAQPCQSRAGQPAPCLLQRQRHRRPRLPLRRLRRPELVPLQLGLGRELQRILFPLEPESREL